MMNKIESKKEIIKVEQHPTQAWKDKFYLKNGRRLENTLELEFDSEDLSQEARKAYLKIEELRDDYGSLSVSTFDNLITLEQFDTYLVELAEKMIQKAEAKKQKEEEKKQKEEALRQKEQEKEKRVRDWIIQYGSERLRKMMVKEYNFQALYKQEKLDQIESQAKKDYPKLIFKKTNFDWYKIPNPSLKALDLLDEYPEAIITNHRTDSGNYTLEAIAIVNKEEGYMLYQFVCDLTGEHIDNEEDNEDDED